MSFDYASIAADARELIEEFGKPVTLVRTIPGTHDPVSGDETGDSEEPTTGSGVETEFDYATRDQSMALQASKRLLCVGIPAPIPMSDRLTVGTESYLVVESKSLEPGTVTLLFDVWVK